MPKYYSLSGAASAVSGAIKWGIWGSANEQHAQLSKLSSSLNKEQAGSADDSEVSQQIFPAVSLEELTEKLSEYRGRIENWTNFLAEKESLKTDPKVLEHLLDKCYEQRCSLLEDIKNVHEKQNNDTAITVTGGAAAGGASSSFISACWDLLSKQASSNSQNGSYLNVGLWGAIALCTVAFILRTRGYTEQIREITERLAIVDDEVKSLLEAIKEHHPELCEANAKRFRLNIKLEEQIEESERAKLEGSEQQENVVEEESSESQQNTHNEDESSEVDCDSEETDDSKVNSSRLSPSL